MVVVVVGVVVVFGVVGVVVVVVVVVVVAVVVVPERGAADVVSDIESDAVPTDAVSSAFEQAASDATAIRSAAVPQLTRQLVGHGHRAGRRRPA